MEREKITRKNFEAAQDGLYLDYLRKRIKLAQDYATEGIYPVKIGDVLQVISKQGLSCWYKVYGLHFEYVPVKEFVPYIYFLCTKTTKDGGKTDDLDKYDIYPWWVKSINGKPVEYDTENKKFIVGHEQ